MLSVSRSGIQITRWCIGWLKCSSCVGSHSQQPYWLTQGLSWYIENKIRKGIYCFPYRNEFVFATEHTSWDNELTNRFKDRKNDPIRPEEFATWMRGKYEGDVARLSYGLVGFIARYHDENFSEFLEALRLHALEENRIELGDGTWERDPNYKLSAKDQAQLIEKFFGGGFLEDAGEFFREDRASGHASPSQRLAAGVRLGARP